MIKAILSIFTFFLATSTVFAMRHASLRPHAPHQRAVIVKNRPTRKFSTHYENNEYETKRQEAWLKLKFDVAERICLMKEKAQKHHDLAKQKPEHAYYARAYQTLAELERDKFELFRHNVEKLSTCALYFEEPDMEAEMQLMHVLHETYAHFYDALPKDNKM